MAVLPWITPEDLKNYTENEDIQKRSDDRLTVDIQRATAVIQNYCNNTFEDEELPDAVKTAVIILSEAYAKNAIIQSQGKVMTSERFDDYSYNAEYSEVDITSLGLSSLLADYVKSDRGTVNMRLRKL